MAYGTPVDSASGWVGHSHTTASSSLYACGDGARQGNEYIPVEALRALDSLSGGYVSVD